MNAQSDFRRGLTALCLLAFFPAPASAADDSTPALPLRSGTTVTILRLDGSRESARLISLAADPPRLLLADSNARRWGGGSWSRELPLAQIAAIEGPGAKEFRGRRIFVGTGAGAFVGGLLGFAFAPDGPSGRQIMGTPPGNFGDLDLPRVSARRLEGAARGIGAGALVGTIVGFLAAPKASPTRRWAFTEAGEAVPDSPQVPIR